MKCSFVNSFSDGCKRYESLGFEVNIKAAD